MKADHEDHVEAYLRRMDIMHLECATSMLVTRYGMSETIEMLQTQIQHLIDHQ